MQALAPARQWADPTNTPSRADEVVQEVHLVNGYVRRERFDLLGRLLRQDEPDGSWLRFQYEADGHLRRVEHSSGEWVEYALDSVARTWTARTWRTETVIHLGQDDLPNRLTQRVDDHTWSVDYQRGRRGRAIAWRYPQARDWLRLESGLTGELVLQCAAQTYCTLTPGAEDGSTTLQFENGVRWAETLSAEPGPRLSGIGLTDSRASVQHALEYDQNGRLSRAGERRFAYDSAGRLRRSANADGAQSYTYDGQGRLSRRRCAGKVSRLDYADSPAASGVRLADGSQVAFSHDALGRRQTRHAADGETRYSYNLFGQLASVQLTGAARVDYLYDGFGRLVGRAQAGQPVVFYVVGLDGERLAEADAAGQVTASYLWLGGQCLARIDGALGAPLSATFHRLYCAWATATGDAAGQVRFGSARDAFGADSEIVDRAPGYAGLFGDPATGLLHAGSRWLDPEVAQFLTPDSWFGSAAAEQALPPRLRTTLRALPGGIGRTLSPTAAYAWCGYDPVNFVDPTGHNWLGMVFSFISAFLWEMQLTSLALEMEVINFVMDIFHLLRLFWDKDGYWRWSVYNSPAPVASGRLMVPFALMLNGLLKIQPDRAWTLGNVIWERRSDLVDLEKKAAGTLLLCTNADTYAAAADEVMADRFRARSPHAQATATVAPGLTVLNSVVVTVPGGAAVGVVFQAGGVADWLAVRLPGATSDEVRQIQTIVGNDITLATPPLPANYAGKAVTVVRLDRAVVRIQKDARVIARQVQFIRGTAVHIGTQVPPDFPTAGLQVTEYLMSGIRKSGDAQFPVEQVFIRLAKDADRAAYAIGNFVRIMAVPGAGAPTAGVSLFFARLVTALHGTVDLMLDTALPTSAYQTIEVVECQPSGVPAVGQNVLPGTLNRIGAAALTDLRPLDGLEIATAAAPPAVQRRIVTQLFVLCSVAALPANLQNTAIGVDRLTPDATTQATGHMQGASFNQIQLDPNQPAAFVVRQAVRVVRISNNVTAFAVLTAVGAALQLGEPLPAADFGNGEPVRVTLLTGVGTFPADNVTPPGDAVLIAVADPTSIQPGDVVRVRLATDVDGGVTRQLTAAPVVVAQLDSDLPPTHVANLSVRRFVPNDATRHGDASAPAIRLRLAVAGPTNPYVAGDELAINDPAQAYGRVDRVVGQDVFLVEPVDLPLALLPGAVKLFAITPTGSQTADGKLDECLVLIPSDHGEPPLTLREALENHEMRHVWQGAVLGPFLLSLPIPWLLHVGFSFGRLSNSVSKVVRHVSVGGIDSLLAAMVWGVGKGSDAIFKTHLIDSNVEIEGTIADTTRKVVVLAEGTTAERMGRFKDGSHITVAKGSDDVFNIVDGLDAAARKVTLRFPLESNLFATNDTVRLAVSQFEQIRKFMNLVFGVNLERLWSDRIPVAWGRALSKLLNRDAWLPFVGMYFLGLYQVGADQYRLPNEEDAAYHSGDLYAELATSDPAEIFVGQFSKLFAYIQARRNILATRGEIAGILTVILPPGVNVTDVAGAVVTTGSRVRFRENYFIQLHERIENAVGVFFCAAQPGAYQVRPPDTRLYDNGLAFGRFAFDVDFVDVATVTVKPLSVTPDPAQPLFETESVTFAIAGDPTAAYALRFPAGPGPNLGRVNGRVYTAPVLAAGAASANQNLEITAAYSRDHPVFHGPGQQDLVRLSDDQLTNLAQVLPLTINSIGVPAIGPVAAGTSIDFAVPLAPVAATVTSALPAGAVVNARIIMRTGRPATLTFVAPNAVTAATDVAFDLVFGSDPAIRRTIPTIVRVNPAP